MAISKEMLTQKTDAYSIKKRVFALRSSLAPDFDLVLLLFIAAATTACVFIPPLSSSLFRSAISLVFVLFVPGNALLAALFPGKKPFENIERAILSFGISIAIIPLLGLLLNFTPWHLNLVPILVSTILFTVLCVAIGYRRRHNLPPEERFSLNFHGT